MTTLPLLLLELSVRIQDSDGVLPQDEQARALREAAGDLGRFRPRERVADIAGNGTSFYALPSGWVAGQSRIVSVECPLGDDPPSYLLATEWTVYRVSDTVEQLRLLGWQPAATQTLRLVYTAPHSLGNTPTLTTLAQDDEAPVINRAAAICCLWLATYYAQQGQASLGADVTSHESKSLRYSDLARQYQARYDEALGIGGAGGHVAPAASSVISWLDASPVQRWGLTHRRRF